jgi:hypothetical protein
VGVIFRRVGPLVRVLFVRVPVRVFVRLFVRVPVRVFVRLFVRVSVRVFMRLPVGVFLRLFVRVFVRHLVGVLLRGVGMLRSLLSRERSTDNEKDAAGEQADRDQPYHSSHTKLKEGVSDSLM